MRSGSITRWTGRLCAGAVALACLAATAQAQDVVISQIYSGAGCGTAGCSYYQNDYIELFNKGQTTAELTNWSVQYASATGSSFTRATIPSASIPAGGYYLIQCGGNANGTNPIPTPDLIPTTTLNLSATAGKVALVKNNTALSSLPTLPDSNIADFVGYGTTANLAEGGSNAPTPGSNNNAIFRKNAGCQDTDNNGSDFEALAAAARNSATPTSSCAAPSNPTGSPSVAPSPVPQGNTVTFTVTVTPGANPTSTGIAVSADTTSIGGVSSDPFVDQGGNVFTLTKSVPCSQPLGPSSVPVVITDAQSRVGNLTINFTVSDGTTTITAQPSNSTVCAGSAAALKVAATGGGLTYQWYNNSGLISNGGKFSGATSATLNISNVQAAEAALSPYYVIVTGACTGAVQSNNVTLAIGSAATAADKEIVISQVYGGGGNSGATLKNDYIELFNKGNVPVDVTGWSVQYASSSVGSAPDFSLPPRITVLTGVINPGKYFLIQEAPGTGGTVNLPTPDVDGTLQANAGILIGSTGGKIALVKHSSPLSGTCPASNGANPDDCGIVDFVGWGGATTGCSEGTAAAAVPNNTSAVIRNSACVDTNDNASDFFVGTANPRNSATPSAPGILTPPASTISCAGSTASFTVVAEGACNVYQWEVNQAPALAGFVPVSTGTGGDTASYTTAALGAGDAGNQYRVVVSNAYGPSVNSAAATLSLGTTPADKQIVIASLYPAGGLGGTPSATYQNDYIELYNKGTTTVDITGWSIQYAAAANPFTQSGTLSGTIAPGNSYLIQLNGDTGCPGPTPCGAALPTPNATVSINLGSTAGKVALVKSATLIAGLCTAAVPSDCRIIDFVGYGATASCYEGAGAAPAPTDRTNELSRANPCTDTDNNNADFVSVAASPSAGGGSSGIPGDFTGDGKVDSGVGLVITGSDFEIFKACETRDGVPYDPNNLPVGCTVTSDCNGKIAADFDKDGDVDMRDFSVFQRCYSGTAPGDPNCAN